MDASGATYLPQLLSGAQYAEPEFFRSEMSGVFEATWQFVATTPELAKPNDFVALELNGKPIVVQNFGGELKAFENVCSHRRARLQTEAHGNRPLVCPYHSFCYDRSGRPEPPPLLNLKLTRQELDGMRLKEYPLEVCGKFIFVHLGASPRTSFAEYAGPIREHLLVCSEGMDEQIDGKQEAIAANWKIVVENFLEFAHIPTVHAATFGRIGLDGSAGFDVELKGLHSQALLKANVQRLASQDVEGNREYLAAFQRRVFKPLGSHVTLVFPNLVIVSVFGLSYLLTSIYPEAPERTRLRYRLFEAKADDGAVIAPALRAHRREVLKAFAYKTVIDEDKNIVETLQRGTSVSDQPGILGLSEGAVHNFQKNVLESLRRHRQARLE
jgi:phenylpropionate dioxygenase-like ring-hydroxylating dioxygenase large terminal subunit